MNKEIKAKWLEALRSGKYKQGKSVLRTVRDEFCCLGVLCDIVAPDKWSKPTENTNYYIHMNTGGVPSFSLYPGYEQELAPGEASQPLGILIKMNDSGKTFAEIANWIEEQL